MLVEFFKDQFQFQKIGTITVITDFYTFSFESLVIPLNLVIHRSWEVEVK